MHNLFGTVPPLKANVRNRSFFFLNAVFKIQSDGM